MSSKPLSPLGPSIVLSCLAACAAPPPAEEPAPVMDLDERVEAVAGAGILEVTPLGEPGVAALVERARAAEAEGELQRSRALLDEALALAPRDPTLWQRLAELNLREGEWEAAAEAARRSFDAGPKVGRLCVRNWLTLFRARTAQGREDEARHAAREADDCPIRPRERL